MVDFTAAMAGALLLAGCAVTPMGPTVAVMPGPNQPFDVFATDQAACKSYAAQQVQGQAERSNQRAIFNSLVPTVLGAGTGAAVGNLYGNPGGGAAAGAAGGALAGTEVAANASSNDQMSIQQQYDNAYVQCMYAKGYDVPGWPPHSVASTEQQGEPGPCRPTHKGPQSDQELAALTRCMADQHPQPQSDPLVASIQTELIRLGLLSGQPDGLIGPRTRGAISNYQQVRGLPVDGKPTQALLDDLRKS
jgi:uncharacterized protein YcfJ